MSERPESADSRKRIRKLQKNLLQITAERDLYKKAVEDAYEKYQLAPSIVAGAAMSTILRKALEQTKYG
jgi:Holliday junction resolvasome RuvABC endonuclease subunit